MSFIKSFFSAPIEQYPEDPKECLALFKAGNIGEGRRSPRQYNLIKRAMTAGVREAKGLFLEAFVWEINNAEILNEVKQLINHAIEEDDHEIKLLYARFLKEGFGSIQKNTKEAWLLYTELATKGSASAAYELGSKSLRNGEWEEAISWLKQADLSKFDVNQALGDAYMGDMGLASRAEQEICDYYTTGLIGFSDQIKDKPIADRVRTALQYYRNAINFYPPFIMEPNVEALYAVSDCIRILGFGNQGLLYECINNLIRASGCKHFQSSFDLACIYSEDKLVPKDLNTAKKYAQLAAGIHKKFGLSFFDLDPTGAKEARRVISMRYINKILQS